MADAGRILIMPKGDYDANSTYENLDLVKHKGTSWLAKKESKGIEPSEANEEYWHKMADSVYDKQSGHYIGNGSTSRIINTGATGTNVIITKGGSQKFAIVTASGYIATDTLEIYTGSNVYCMNDGTIRIYTSNDIFNSEGETYYYSYL